MEGNLVGWIGTVPRMCCHLDGEAVNFTELLEKYERKYERNTREIYAIGATHSGTRSSHGSRAGLRHRQSRQLPRAPKSRGRHFRKKCVLTVLCFSLF